MKKLIFGLFLFSLTLTTASHAGVLVAKNMDAPEFLLESVFDETKVLRTSDLKDKVNLIVFFGTWCPYCQKEHPQIVDLQNKYNFNLSAIAVKDRNDKVMKFLEERGNPFTFVGVDQRGKLSRAWGLRQVPAIFILDKQAKVRYIHYGALDMDLFEEAIYPKIEALMNE